MNIGGPSYYDDSGQQEQFARHDIVILGFYPGWQGDGRGRPEIADVVRNIRRRNPDIAVGQYTILQESQDAKGHPNRAKAEKLTQEKWWLVDKSGRRVQWTESYAAWDINVSAWMSPDRNGKRYSEWLAEYDYNEYFRQVPEFEIWYLDNALSRPAVRYADWDGDGVNDSRDDPRIAAAYREGNVRHWRRIRELSPRSLLMGNSDDMSSPEYRGVLNGAFLESIIGESWSTETRLGWRAAMARYRASLAQTANPHIVGFNVHGEANDYARMRYGLTSCLLDDGYFSYTEAGSNYRNVTWFDEFDLDLGHPIDLPPLKEWSGPVFRRRFERGAVLVNPSALPVTVNLEPGYRRFVGRQDPLVNDGTSARRIRLGGKDGIVLLRE